jgi:hypothetical protein
MTNMAYIEIFKNTNKTYKYVEFFLFQLFSIFPVP